MLQGRLNCNRLSSWNTVRMSTEFDDSSPSRGEWIAARMKQFSGSGLLSLAFASFVFLKRVEPVIRHQMSRADSSRKDKGCNSRINGGEKVFHSWNNTSPSWWGRIIKWSGHSEGFSVQAMLAQKVSYDWFDITRNDKRCDSLRQWRENSFILKAIHPHRDGDQSTNGVGILKMFQEFIVPRRCWRVLGTGGVEWLVRQVLKRQTMR